MTQTSEVERTQKERFKRQLQTGQKQYCPTCDRQALLSKTSLNSTLTWMLIRLYRKSIKLYGQPKGWVHVNEFSPRQHSSGRNFCIVHHWDLAVSRGADNGADKRTAGEWRLTHVGVAFIQNELGIPKYLFVFNNKVVRPGTDIIWIEEALQKKFRYSELMEAP